MAKSTKDDPAFDPAPVDDQSETLAAADPAKPGDKSANPAEPLAPTTIPAAADPAPFLSGAVSHPGFPKTVYHPVHGGITLTDPNQEAQLIDRRSWFDLPELADAARTWTEAHIAGANNTRAKLAAHDEAGHALVRNSVQADESVRAGNAEPL